MFGDESGDESLRFVFGEVELQASEGDVLVLMMPVCDDGGWSRVQLGLSLKYWTGSPGHIDLFQIIVRRLEYDDVAVRGHAR